MAMRPKIRVDGAVVKPSAAGYYEVVIAGFGLYAAQLPPNVLVGELPVFDLKFENQGRILRGVLREKPRSAEVIVDYGFARAEGTAQ